MIPSSDSAPRKGLFFGLFALSLLALYAILVISSGSTIELTASADRWGLIAFLALAVLSEIYPLRVPLGHATLSMSGIIFWCLIVLFPPAVASACTFCAILVSEIIDRRSFSKTIFNSSQTALSTFIGGVIFVAIAQGNGLVGSLAFFIGFVSGAFTYWITNTVLVSIAADLLYNENAYAFWRRNFQWAFVYELTSAPIALAVAFAYQELWLVGLLLVSLPILMVRLAYSQYLELKRTYRETVRTLVKIIEMHDPYTAGHSDRVATYARRLCECLRLPPSTTEKIELAAFLHDLGKIHLDLSNIIRKAGKLNEEERRLIKLHSVVSADLANQVSYFKGEIEAMIRHHHENWDGTGYPHGLRGEQIPLGSRVILLADAFDAMTTSRVYRDALDLERVKKEFGKFAGIQFDPRLTPVFLDDVVGDGEGLIRQPMDEPLEGQRARLEAVKNPSSHVHDIRNRVLG
jgi:HD-GYP domain-containing protein (c-di-GMP phosphodiesterase class II)